ncbi:MAG: molybdopterin molybdotransferase MoeA [Actinomycetota bacterium]
MSKRVVTGEELARPLVPYKEAVATVLAAFRVLEPQRVAVERARGLVLAESVRASIDVPGFANSAMDGYAIQSRDVSKASKEAPVRLRVTGDLPAGASPASVTVEPGTAATIMTGAPLPEGADCVVPWEDTTRIDEASIDVNAIIVAGRNVRPAGEDVKAGDEILVEGSVLSPVHLGVAASLGLTHLLVHPKPKIAVLSTGDELVPPGGKLLPGQIFESNKALIGAMCEAAGGEVIDDALLPDDPDVIGEWMASAAERSDLIVTSGGASVGEHDWIRAILEKEGSLELWRVAIKPGKPIAFGTIGDTKVLGLPGNPGSAFVGLHVFVQPAIRTMAGLDPKARSMSATLGADVKGSPSRTQFTRVRLEDDQAIPLPAQSSVVLSNLIPADGFAIVPPGGLPKGSIVTVELL